MAIIENTSQTSTPKTVLPLGTSDKFQVGSSADIRKEVELNKQEALGLQVMPDYLKNQLAALGKPPTTTATPASVPAPKPAAATTTTPAGAQTQQSPTVAGASSNVETAVVPPLPVQTGATATPAATTTPGAVSQASGDASGTKYTGQKLADGEELHWQKGANGLTEQYVRQKAGYVPPPDASMNDLNAAEQRIQEISAGLGIITPEEQERIFKASEDVAAQYQPLISEANEQKRQGMAKGLVAAGERGGLINTQFAGVAALQPTVGGDFVGAGGELENMKSAYDRNISALKSAAISAQNQAMAQTREAILTGKRQDLSAAKVAYDAALEKFNAVSKAQDDHLNLLMKTADYAKQARETAAIDAADMIRGGTINEETIADPLFQEQFEKVHSLPTGTGKGVLELARSAVQTEKVTDATERQKMVLENASRFVELQDKIPLGKTVTINGVSYTGTSKSDTLFTGVETDDRGFMSYYEHNRETGETTIAPIGQIGKGEQRTIQMDQDGNYFSVDVNGANAIPIEINNGGAGAVNQMALAQMFPGEKPPAGAKNGWCLSFIGQVDERGSDLVNQIGDSIDSKRASVELDIGFGKEQRMPQAGDYILTNESPQYGHIGLITKTYLDPNTKKMMGLLTESNYKAGVVTHTRAIELDGKNMEGSGGKILGFIEGQLKSQFTNQPQQLRGTTKNGSVDESEAEAYAEAVNSGQLNLVNVPQAIRGSVIPLLKKQEDVVSLLPPEQKEVASAMQKAIASAGIKFTEAQRGEIPKQVNSMLAEGDVEGARDFIYNTARQMASAPEQERAVGRTNGLAALDNVESLLAQLEANGGDTGFIVGNWEKMAARIGQTADPELRRIQNEIRLALVDYRKAVSGAAFTESEGKEYDRLFPSIGNVKELNKANIDSLRDTFSRNDRLFYEQMLGKKNYGIIESGLGSRNKTTTAEAPATNITDYKDQVLAARGQFSDDDILNRIKTRDPAMASLIDEALSQPGMTAKQVLDFISR